MQLLCAGEAFEDLIFVGLDRLPELGEEIKTDRFTATIGGGAVITAVQAARLGMRTQLISASAMRRLTRLKKERVTVTNLRKNERTARDYRGALDRRRSRLRHLQRCEHKARGRRRNLASLSAEAASASEGRRILHLCFYPHDCHYWTAIVSKLRNAASPRRGTSAGTSR